MEELKCRFPSEYTIGQLYYIQDEFDDKKFIITTCNGVADGHRIKGRYLTNYEGELQFASGETTPYVINRPSRLATFEELKWYTACVRADKLIPKEEAKSNRVIPAEKSYAITEHQLHTLHDIGNPVIKEMLENWFTYGMFHPMVAYDE